jgi:AraC-like DNA-binding protein
MTIYEQIQRALDGIEAALFSRLGRKDAAGAAGMSERSFQDYFWAVTGYSYKEYVVKRRLAEALRLLSDSRKGILEIALEVGYESHEAFGRAFKKEFGLPPGACRLGGPCPQGLGRLALYKERYMGVIVKELPRALAAAFEGYGQDCEGKAKAKLEAWMRANPAAGRPRRIFGHNIDGSGALARTPEHAGYKFLATIAEAAEAAGAGTELLEAGRFAVTGIEGNFEEDPQGAWIGEGWARMNDMIAEKGFKVKAAARWFEEELDAAKPRNLRLDLYLEIE